MDFDINKIHIRYEPYMCSNQFVFDIQRHINARFIMSGSIRDMNGDWLDVEGLIFRKDDKRLNEKDRWVGIYVMNEHINTINAYNSVFDNDEPILYRGVVPKDTNLHVIYSRHKSHVCKFFDNFIGGGRDWFFTNVNPKERHIKFFVNDDGSLVIQKPENVIYKHDEVFNF